MSLVQEEAVRKTIRQWAEDPVLFCTEALKVKFISSQQKQGFEELRKLVWAKIKRAEGKSLTTEEEDYARRIGLSIMSGRGTGKDAFASMAVIWFLCCFPSPLVPCTAPTGHQLRDILWREINKWRMGLDHNDPPLVKDWITWQSDKIYLTVQKGRDWYAVARTSNAQSTKEEQEETLQGFHEDYMMMVIDEASGVPDPVYKPLESSLTGKCNFIVNIFNPTRRDGFAADSQTKNRDRWVCLHWSTEDSDLPNAQFYVEDMAKNYGTDSNFYRVNVKGLFPVSSSDTLIPYEWVIDAINRDLVPLPEDPEVAGVDVGAGGDPSVYLEMRGPVVAPIKQNDTSDSEVLTGWLMSRIFEQEPRAVMVDVIGVGWAIEGNLRSRISTPGLNIIGVNVAELPAQDERFFRLRDELAWKVRERFEHRSISIPNDPQLIAEATSIKFTEPNGKIKIESKKEMKKRGIVSPNRFDALCLAHYYETNMLRKWSQYKTYRQKPTTSSWKTV